MNIHTLVLLFYIKVTFTFLLNKWLQVLVLQLLYSVKLQLHTSYQIAYENQDHVNLK